MPTISVNGTALTKIGVLLERAPGDLSATVRTFREGSFSISTLGETIRLRLPAQVAVEMYRTGLLPADEKKSLRLEVAGEDQGRFFIIDFRYPETLDSPEMLTITLGRDPAPDR